MSILPGNKAPWFSSIGFQENKFMDISINDYTGKWLLLFFYPLDFGYVSPSELLELEARRPELESLNCRYTTNLIPTIPTIPFYFSLLAVSQDSVVVHEHFADLNPGYGGVFGIKFPLMEDKDGNISKLYGVDKAQAGHSFRAYFIIDPSQVLKNICFQDLVPTSISADCACSGGGRSAGGSWHGGDDEAGALPPAGRHWRLRGRGGNQDRRLPPCACHC